MRTLKCLEQILAVSFVFVLLGQLTACYPWFDNPLPIPKDGPKVDERILGSWASSNNKPNFEKNDGYVHIYPKGDGWVDVFYHEIGKEGYLQYSGYTVKVGYTPILCLWMTQIFKDSLGEGKMEKSPQCWLFPYKVTDDGMLHIWGVDAIKLEKCIEEGKVKGEISRTTSKMRERKKITVQATSEELESFFISSGVGVLIDKKPDMSFYRLNKPEFKPFSPPEKP